MKDKIKKNLWLFKQFLMINHTAKMVYDAIQGGIDQNFYQCYVEYEDGRFGNVKEATAFSTAITIYDEYTANDGWELVGQFEDEFEGLSELDIEEIKKLKKEFSEQLENI